MSVSLDTQTNLLLFNSRFCWYPSSLLCWILSLGWGTPTTPIRCSCCCSKFLFCWSIFGFVSGARSFLISEQYFPFQAHNLNSISLMTIAIHCLKVFLSVDSYSTPKTLQNHRFFLHYEKEIYLLGFSRPKLHASLC